MAIALNSYTALAYGNGNVTTASFTPPAGSVLFVCGFIAPGNASAPGVTDNLSTHLTYTQRDVYQRDSNRTAALWTATVSVSQAMTVTVTNPGNVTWVQVIVMTGVNSSNPVGNVGHNIWQPPLNVSYNVSVSRSRMGFLYTDSGNKPVCTATTGETTYGVIQFGGYLNSQFAEALFLKDANSTGTTETMTCASNNSDWIMGIYFEMLPAALAQVLTETATISDTILKAARRILPDTATITDMRMNQTSKPLLEALAVSETLLKAVAKFLALEALAVTDACASAWLYFRTLLETLTIGDTLARMRASLVTLLEALTVNDTLARACSKLLQEAATVTGSAARSTSKLLAEGIAIADSVVRLIGKVLEETAAFADTLMRRAELILSEVVAVTESAVRSAARNLAAESIAITDVLARQTRTLLVETLAIAETLGLGRLYSRVLSEVIALTDVVAASWKRLLQFVVRGRP